MAVIRPANPMAKLLIAPSASPISIAFEVPRAWDDVPIAIPMATGSFIFINLNTVSAIMAPVSPVIIIAATVISGIPPICFDTSMPIGVVTDLGTSDNPNKTSSSNALAKSMIEVTPTLDPTKIPPMIGRAFSFSSLMFLYRGIAKATVAGARKKEMISPPFL